MLSHSFYKARPLFTNHVRKRVVKEVGWEWGKYELVQWWCDRWDAYFGYDRSYWYRAANYYYHPYWAWRLCARYGYFS